MKKQFLAFLLALVVFAGVIAISTVAVQAQTEAMTLLYDDRKELSELIGKSAANVSISNETVISYVVGSTQKDAHVLTYENGTLYAVGVGTATLTVDGTAYQVTVKAAPISLFMITGHSVGAGQYGTASQSVAVEAGQAYSSYYYKSLDTSKVDGYGLGYGSANRAGEASSVQYGSTGSLDAFAPGNGGTTSTGSALAYQWNKLTGEKVWVLNAAVPGSCINEWQEGHTGHHTGTSAYAYNYYDKAVEMFGCAQAILKNEIAAGHYTLSHMAIAYFNGTNFTNASYTDWTLDSLKEDYEGMWNGFKTAFTADMDGDGITETVEALGIVPFWNITNQDYSGDKATTYYMAASQEWPDVFTLSDVYRGWTTAAGLETFPAIDYATNSGEEVIAPESVKHSDQGGTSEWSLFCSNDNTHLSQVAYNAVGLDMGNNLYQYLCCDETATSAHFEDVAGNALDSFTVTPGEQKAIVPVVEPAYGKKVTLAATGAVSLNGNCVVADTAGSGTLTLAIDGTVADTVSVTVAQHIDHCACGGHAKGMTGHSCTTLSGWTAWGNTETERTTLPTTSGNYYLTENITLKTVSTVASGVDVKLCLNGYNITTTATGSRLINQKGTLSITNCSAKGDWGTLSSAITNKYAAIMYTYENSVTNLYGGNLDASQASITLGGAVLVYGGTMNVYGGSITGAQMVADADVTEVRGGVIHLLKSGKLNMYGGTLQGGSGDVNGGGVSIKAGTTFQMYGGSITACTAVSGGAVYNEGTFTMTGGTVSGGTAQNGGNIYNLGVMTLNGGTVSGGTASSCGGNIYQTNTADSVLTVSGGTISGGKATNGGNIQNHGNITMTGGLISGGAATTGGNIRLFRPGVFTLDGGTVEGGTATGNGGVFQVVGHTATTAYAQVATLNIKSGKIIGGSAKNGGTIIVERFGVLNMEGGTIQGGTASEKGGCIYIYSQYADRDLEVNISGGEIIGGTATLGEGIYITADAGAQAPVLTVSKDAKLNGTGTGLYVNNASDVDVQFSQLSGADTLITVDAADKTAAFAATDSDYAVYMISAQDGYGVSYSDGSLSFIVDTAAKVAAVYEGKTELARYSSLEAATVAAGNGYIKLLADVETDHVLTGSVWIDLNGFDLSGITVAGKLYGMDSATDQYSDANAGTLTATVTGEGQVVLHHKTTARQAGSIKRYLTVQDGNNYSFHRFYLGITKISLAPSSYGVGYKAEFHGDDAVKGVLAQTETFGYQLWVEDYSPVRRSFDADQFGVKKEVTLRIQNFLDPAEDVAFNEERANMPVNAKVFIALACGETIETDVVSYTFKDVMELVANTYDSYNATQKEAIDKLAEQFKDMFFTWAVPTMHHLSDDWTAWDSTSTVPSTTGKYYLNADVDTTAAVKIAPDQEVTLCLNGHTVSGSARIYYVSGTLNICDCCCEKEEAQQGYMIGNGTSIGPVLYTYYGGTVNLYSGNLTATNQVTTGGVLLMGNDTGKFSNENPHDNVFNMYGGRIYGGQAAEYGGNIRAVHGAVINIYGGEILDGAAGLAGGAIYLKGKNTNTLNIYGGTISGGTAGTIGGNIAGTDDAHINIYGGTITGGTALQQGGNVAIDNNNLTMEGGVISGGKANAGGNIHFVASDTTAITLNGGTITGGRAETHGGNLYLVNDGTYIFNNMTISDGYAAGDGGNLYLFTDMNRAHTTEEEFDVLLQNCTVIGGEAGDEGDSIYVMEADVTISGSTVIQNVGGESLHLGAGETVELKDLTADAKVYVSMAIPGTLSDDTKYLSNIHADDTSMELQIVGGAIKLIDEATAANVPTLSGFSIGWYRGDITPTEPVPLDGMGNDAGRMDNWEIKTPLQAGVTVIADETGIENAIILVSVDTLFIQKELSDNLAQAISDATGVPKNRIFFSASHSHCAVAHDEPYEQTRNYLEDFYTNVTSYAVQAVEDLAPATIQTAAIDVIATDGLSLTASRRNIGDDGNAYSKVDGNVPSGAERESATDPQLQLIRFIREDKTDLVLSNYQTHGTGWGSATDGFVSADTWYYFRNTLEASMEDTACTFFLGASGNLSQNNNSLIAKFQSVDGNTYKAYNYLGIDKCLEGMGALLTSYALYAFDNYAEDVQPDALRVINTTFETEDHYKADKQTYKQIDMDLNAIAIGDSIAFITAPYEMYHENGQQIKAYAQTLGFDTCFILTNSMGENKYIASNNAFENDSTDGKLTSFGVRTCRFKQGTAEALIDQFADMLAQIKGVSPANTIYDTYTVYVQDQNGNAVQNVMVELVGGGNTRNCSDADGTVTYYVYDGIEYAINVVKLPSGYTYDGTVVSFDENNTVTITVTAE